MLPLLKIALQQNVEAPEDLSYAKTSERTYHRDVPAGVSVGCKDWTVSCVSNLPVEQALIRLEEKLDSELQTVNKKLQALTDDSEQWATRFLKNVAGEALLWAYGDQPAYQGHSYCLCVCSSPQSRPYQARDGITNRRNSTVHFGDVQGLEQAVQDVLGLLARHSELRRRWQHEAMIIDSFDDLKTAFNL